jgi:hypothetical protein
MEFKPNDDLRLTVNNITLEPSIEPNLHAEFQEDNRRQRPAA